MAARIGAVTAAALLLAVVGGFLQEWTGRHAYEQPRLDRSRYVGDWIGGGAYRLRLGENGEAEGINLPLADENAGPWGTRATAPGRGPSCRSPRPAARPTTDRGTGSR